MPGRKDWKAAVRLENQAAWSLPQFAAVLGHVDGYLYKRLTWNEHGTAGIVHLPGGINVPVHKDANGEAVIYRRQYEAAVDNAPPVEVVRWQPTTEVDQ